MYDDLQTTTLSAENFSFFPCVKVDEWLCQLVKVFATTDHKNKLLINKVCMHRDVSGTWLVVNSIHQSNAMKNVDKGKMNRYQHDALSPQISTRV